jgi:pyridoxine 5-phosphate synthase
MGATPEMVAIACDIKPHSAMLVPEGRNEVTTEGGLDVVGKRVELAGVVAKLRGAGCRVSAFIDADAAQIAAAADLGFDICELHTGPYAHAFAHAGGNMKVQALSQELARLRSAMERVLGRNMSCNAGHALNYNNVGLVASLLRTTHASPNAAGPASAANLMNPLGSGVLHIGHAIIARAIFTGLKAATHQMKQAIAESR